MPRVPIQRTRHCVATELHVTGKYKQNALSERAHLPHFAKWQPYCIEAGNCSVGGE